MKIFLLFIGALVIFLASLMLLGTVASIYLVIDGIYDICDRKAIHDICNGKTKKDKEAREAILNIIEKNKERTHKC